MTPVNIGAEEVLALLLKPAHNKTTDWRGETTLGKGRAERQSRQALTKDAACV